METAYALEANPIVTEISEFEQLLSADKNFREKLGEMYIYTTDEAANEAKQLLEEVELFENIHPLLVLSDGIEGENFFDFGIKSQHAVYLFREMISAFSLEGEEQMKTMAKLQLEEHLVYQSAIDSLEIFFVERHLNSLVRGITNAYQCEARFLDLDKWKKKL
jgi:hypothetical protein